MFRCKFRLAGCHSVQTATFRKTFHRTYVCGRQCRSVEKLVARRLLISNFYLLYPGGDVLVDRIPADGNA